MTSNKVETETEQRIEMEEKIVPEEKMSNYKRVIRYGEIVKGQFELVKTDIGVAIEADPPKDKIIIDPSIYKWKGRKDLLQIFLLLAFL